VQARPSGSGQEVTSNHARRFTCCVARAFPRNRPLVFMQGSPDEQ
jgi:hypothetical protein